jgi:hypothetical protein
MIVMHPHFGMYEAAAFAIKTPAKGVFGHVTNTGDRSSARLQRKGMPRRHFVPRRQKPYGNFRDALDRLQDGGEYCSGGKADAAVSPGLTLVKFPIEYNGMP